MLKIAYERFSVRFWTLKYEKNCKSYFIQIEQNPNYNLENWLNISFKQTMYESTIWFVLPIETLWTLSNVKCNGYQREKMYLDFQFSLCELVTMISIWVVQSKVALYNVHLLKLVMKNTCWINVHRQAEWLIVTEGERWV